MVRNWTMASLLSTILNMSSSVTSLSSSVIYIFYTTHYVHYFSCCAAYVDILYDHGDDDRIDSDNGYSDGSGDHDRDRTDSRFRQPKLPLLLQGNPILSLHLDIPSLRLALIRTTLLLLHYCLSNIIANISIS